MDLLKLTTRERLVWKHLQNGLTTPLQISRNSTLARQTIYRTLESLQNRGLVKRRIKGGTHYWQPVNDQELTQTIEHSKQLLTHRPTTSSERHSVADNQIIIHQGRQAVQEVFLHSLTASGNHPHTAIQGDPRYNGWEQVFDISQTHQVNQLIKDQGVIVQSILGHQWYEHQVRNFGFEWLRQIEGRSAITYMVDQKYIQHGGQIWFSRQAVYLASMSEQLVVEVRNRHIRNMLFQLVSHMHDHGQLIDVNQLVRNFKQS